MGDEIFDKEKVDGIDEWRGSWEEMSEKKRDATGDMVVGSVNRMINKLDDFTVSSDGTIVLSQEELMKNMGGDIQIEAELRKQGLNEKEIKQFMVDLDEMKNLAKSKDYDQVFSKIWGKIYGDNLAEVNEDKMMTLKNYYKESGYSFGYLINVLNDVKKFENSDKIGKVAGPGFIDKYWESYDPKVLFKNLNSIKTLFGDSFPGENNVAEKLFGFWTWGTIESKYPQVVASNMGKYLRLAVPSLNGIDDNEMILFKEMQEQLYQYGKDIVKDGIDNGQERQNKRQIFKENLRLFINNLGMSKSVVIPEKYKDFYEMVKEYKIKK